MIYVTYATLRAAGASPAFYMTLRRTTFEQGYTADHTPIPLTVILDTCGLSEALWALQATTAPDQAQRFSISLAREFAEHVLKRYQAFLAARWSFIGRVQLRHRHKRRLNWRRQRSHQHSSGCALVDARRSV